MAGKVRTQREIVMNLDTHLSPAILKRVEWAHRNMAGKRLDVVARGMDTDLGRWVDVRYPSAQPDHPSYTVRCYPDVGQAECSCEGYTHAARCYHAAFLLRAVRDNPTMLSEPCCQYCDNLAVLDGEMCAECVAREEAEYATMEPPATSDQMALIADLCRVHGLINRTEPATTQAEADAIISAILAWLRAGDNPADRWERNTGASAYDMPCEEPLPCPW